MRRLLHVGSCLWPRCTTESGHLVEALHGKEERPVGRRRVAARLLGNRLARLLRLGRDRQRQSQGQPQSQPEYRPHGKESSRAPGEHSTLFRSSGEPIMRRLLVAIVAIVAAFSSAPFASAQTFKVVMHSDVKALDPVWSGAYITRNLRLHAVRHAVRARREPAGQAADGRQVGDQPRRPDLDLHAARRARVPRRHAGHGGRRHRLAEALGAARFDGPEARGLRGRMEGGRRQDLPDRAEAEVRAAARGARQAVGGGAVHHARRRRPRRRTPSSRATT